jgi:hypothetical protein
MLLGRRFTPVVRFNFVVEHVPGGGVLETDTANTPCGSIAFCTLQPITSADHFQETSAPEGVINLADSVRNVLSTLWRCRRSRI